MLAKDCRIVCCEVRADNQPSRALLARNGYSEAEPLPGYYDDGADGIRMVKQLCELRIIQKPHTFTNS